MQFLKVKRLDPRAQLPVRAHSDDCGLDIFTLEGAILKPSEGKMFRTGIAGQFVPGYVGMLTDRSSMAKRGFKLAGGIIDPHFTSELKVMLRNITNGDLTVQEGERIAQLLIIPISNPEIIEVFEIEETGPRGQNGFGSSGR